MKVMISKKEILSFKNPVYDIAHMLRENGAPIKFNWFNVKLEEKDIYFTRKMTVDFLPCGGRLFTFYKNRT